MAQKTEDLRVRRTRKLLEKALLEATIEKGFAQVSVRDITERAMVNRSTFYRHYLDKHDLLSHYMEELYAQVPPQEGGSAPGDAPGQDPKQPPLWLVGILKHVQRNTEFYRVMLGKKGDPAFCAEGFRQFIEKQFREILPADGVVADPTRPPIDLSVSYISHAAIGVIMWWLEDQQSHTPEQVAGWLHKLSQATVRLSTGTRFGSDVS